MGDYWVKFPCKLVGEFYKQPHKNSECQFVLMKLLTTANWIDCGNLLRGQLKTTWGKLAEDIPISTKNIRRRVERLVANGYVKVEPYSNYDIDGVKITLLQYESLDTSTNKGEGPKTISTHDRKRVKKWQPNGNLGGNLMATSVATSSPFNELELQGNSDIENKNANLGGNLMATSVAGNGNLSITRINRELNILVPESATLTPAVELAEFWNKTLPMCTQVKMSLLSKSRIANVEKALKETGLTVEDVKNTIKNIKLDSWLIEEYKPSFDWLFTKNREKKILNLVIRYEKFTSSVKIKQPKVFLT
jgi:hypothetical protein